MAAGGELFRDSAGVGDLPAFTPPARPFWPTSAQVRSSSSVFSSSRASISVMSAIFLRRGWGSIPRSVL